MVSNILVNIDWSKGLMPAQYQTITWTSVNLLSIGLFRNKLEIEGTKPLPEPMLTYSQSAHNKEVKLEAKYNNFISGKRI